MWRSHSRAVATTPSRQPVEQPEAAQHEPALAAVDDVEVRCGQQMRQRHDADLTGRRDQPHRGTGQRSDGVLSAVKDHPIRDVQHTPPDRTAHRSLRATAEHSVNGSGTSTAGTPRHSRVIEHK